MRVAVTLALGEMIYKSDEYSRSTDRRSAATREKIRSSTSFTAGSCRQGKKGAASANVPNMSRGLLTRSIIEGGEGAVRIGGAGHEAASNDAKVRGSQLEPQRVG